MKICQQCGRTLNLDSFRSYYARGKAAGSVGTNTICKTCESLNAKVNRLFKIDSRDEAQQKLLDETAKFYKELASRGLQPKGRYAAYVLGLEEESTKDEVFMDLFKEVLTPSDNIIDEYNKLLTLELTEEPDVHQAELQRLLDRTCLPNGKPKPEYADIYMRVVTRYDDYEDNYEW